MLLDKRISNSCKITRLYFQKNGFKPKGPNKNVGVHFLGNFENGKAVGNFWIGMHGGGFLQGKVDKSGMISGDDISYIYPDGETALLGRFEDRFMKKAFNVDVLKYACDNFGLLYVERYSKKVCENVFKYELPTNISFGGGGIFPDPFEQKFLKVQKSSGELSNLIFKTLLALSSPKFHS